MSTQPDLFGSPDPQTVAVVESVDKDYRREDDRYTIDRAIERVAMRDGGLVDPNAVRKELAGPYGLTVNPRSLSARYMALSRSGALVWEGQWTVSDDTAGRNAGKPAKVRRWTGREAA